ncbi:MAG: metal ABC transporter ATP-binding protein [Lentisphaerales bacterium]|nr:metal ABC transporter ATP-binding protein [Lentisphaerales bacterium]
MTNDKDIQVKIENLTLGYSNNPLVSEINLNITTGDFWGIVGANGQGKSTFIKSIMGLVSPLKGKIEYNSLKQADIGYIPQSSSFSPNLPVNVSEFISLAAPGIIFSKKRKTAVNEALETVWLEDKRKRSYSTLSGGERQRLHIARALARKPKLIILDEPDTGLDFTSVGNLFDLLVRLNTEQNITILLITHHINTAIKLTAKTMLFTHGQVKSGNTKEIMTKENIVSAFMSHGTKEALVDKWLGEV